MVRVVSFLAAVLSTLIPLECAAEECDRLALELFDVSRRSRSILDAVRNTEQTCTEAMARYDEELPSGPGFAGGAVVVRMRGYGDVPVCAGGVDALPLDGTQIAALARWRHPTGRWGATFTAVGSALDLTHDDTRVAIGRDGVISHTSWYTFLTHEQSYVGGSVRTPYVEVGVGVISGRHLEAVTGRTGVNGWSMHGLFILHLPMWPMRIELRVGSGRNQVERLEHAAAFADRGGFDTQAVLSTGW